MKAKTKPTTNRKSNHNENNENNQLNSSNILDRGAHELRGGSGTDTN
jgi:hypothetical protein